MKTLKLKITLLFGIVIILFNSCKKKETPGPAGKDGIANISSTIFSATNWSWSSPYYYVNLSVSELTSSNINSAAVMVYFNKGGNWIAAPYAQYNSPYDYFMGFNTSAGNIQVTWFYDTSLANGSDPNAYYGVTVQIKVIVIPPAMIKKYPNVDLNNYCEVKEVFNLKD